MSPQRREAISLPPCSATAFFFVFFFFFLFFGGDFGLGRGSNGTDKQYHRPDLNERYKTRVMRPAMREGIVDQRLARLQGHGSERERTESQPPSSRTNPLSFIHDPTFLPNQPPLHPSSLASSSLPPFLSSRLSLFLHRSIRRAVSFSRHSYLAIFETQPWVSLSMCLRVLVRGIYIYIYIYIYLRIPPFVHLYPACLCVGLRPS